MKRYMYFQPQILIMIMFSCCFPYLLLDSFLKILFLVSSFSDLQDQCKFLHCSDCTSNFPRSTEFYNNYLFRGFVMSSQFLFFLKSAILCKDPDMMVDATLFLWSKCKPHFQRVMSPSLENCKQLLSDVFANRVRYQMT